MFLADGESHTWSLDYDPAGADGAGQITFALDGKVYKAALTPGHKTDGAVFDRFGIMNVQISGRSITPWLDDLVIDGVREDFSADPGWEFTDWSGDLVSVLNPDSITITGDMTVTATFSEIT